jgi:hypothetical protein
MVRCSFHEHFQCDPLIARCGLRVTEPLNLRIKDVDFRVFRGYLSALFAISAVKSLWLRLRRAGSIGVDPWLNLLS